MTGFMHERAISRKTFVKGGGALIVGFSLAGTAGKAQAANANTPFGQRSPADFLPDPFQIDSWITVNADNTVTVTHGETELGHGTPTGILMLVAEELDMNMSQMHFAHVESWLQAVGGGSGSSGISTRSQTIRTAAALARQTLLGLASKQLGVPATQLSVADGVVSGGGKTVKYGDLLGGKLFMTQMTQANTGTLPAPAGNAGGFGTQPFGSIPGQPGSIVKPVSQYKVVGKAFPRIDIPAKVMGTYTYVQNVRIPGMLHARVVRPRGAGANTVENSKPLSIDESSISHIPNAQVVRVNDFVAVVAPREYDAIQAAAQLKVVWETKQGLPGDGNFWGWLRQVGDTNTQNPPRLTADDGPAVEAGLSKAAKTVSATYRYHYNSFMPIGPHCAVADIHPDGSGGTIYVQAQAINGIPGTIQSTLAGLPAPYGGKFANTPAANFRVIWYEGASSFGGGQTGEVNEQAAVISAVIGKPVRVQWMRWDQHGWDHYGMANLWDVTMGADSNGKIVAANWQTYGQAQSNIDETRRVLGQQSWPATPGSGGIAPSDGGSTATPYSNTLYTTAYKYPRRVTAKTQPLYGGAFKCNFLRAPSAPQSYFASEQIVDELAHALNMDPVAFRRQNIDPSTTIGARWLAVLDAATLAAGWKPKVAASNVKSGDVVTGRGIGLGTFASSQVAIVADVQVNKKTGRIWTQHLTIAQNNGITVGPQLVANQMSGAAIQGLSRAIWEQNRFNKERITSLDWVSYPILRFKDTPSVTLINVHPGEYTVVVPGALDTDVTKGNAEAYNEGWTLTGSGEPPTAAVGSAVANAFFDATGVRIRQSPMNPTNVRATLKAAGVA
jgi:nicotinate dehydrogenase subunit B